MDYRNNAAAQGMMSGMATAAGIGQEALIRGDMQQQPQSETELQYSARMATESLAVLEKSVHELASRLTAVLEHDAPTPTPPQTDRAVRALSSPIANALMAHAQQADGVTSVVRNLLRRLVL